MVYPESYYEENCPDVIPLIKMWSDKRVWRGTLEERKQKFMWMHEKLKILFNKPDVNLIFGEITEESERSPGSSGNSYYNTQTQDICLVGKLSVVTFLHEWAHAIGLDQENAIGWSQGLFKIGFPNSFARAVKRGGLALKPEDVEAVLSEDPDVYFLVKDEDGTRLTQEKPEGSSIAIIKVLIGKEKFDAWVDGILNGNGGD